MLREEELTFDAHKAKKCSFTTSRPTVWAKTIESHLREIVNPYFSSKYKSYDGQYLEYTLYYNGEEDKKVTINIYVKTGVILIQGEHYQYWAEKVFPVLKEQVTCHAAREQKKYDTERSDRKRSNSVHNASSRDVAGKERSKSVGNLTHVGKDMCATDITLSKPDTETKTVDCVMNDMGCLWKENITLKSALRKLETDYEMLTGELESVQKTSTVQSREIDKIYTKVIEESSTTEKTKKCSVGSAECENNVEARSKLITDSALKLETQISEMRDRLQSKITEIRNTIGGNSTPSFCKCHLWSDLAKIQSHIAAVQQLILCDIDELKSRVSEIETGFGTMTAQLPKQTETLKKLEDEHQNVQVNVEGIKNSLDEMRKKMLLAWSDYDSYKCIKCTNVVQ